ncbi:Alcohol dehydrogenase superfamily [Macleaya cordata]|uniref:Alcohol dehydrogenase superfamily n=1 Tax=Macleaya cordata TaxID=56857 RepID=A0A200PTT7_MACCD|nr:Alcohol dehydrogenase superfamily [Macleaya cordata]
MKHSRRGGWGWFGSQDFPKVVAMLKYSKGSGLAQYALASEKLIVKRPDRVSAPEGAGYPLAGLTALYTLSRLTSNTTKAANILVTAASGGVGHYAVQLAKLGNNHVTATWSSKRRACQKFGCR